MADNNEENVPSKLPLLISKPTAPPPLLPPSLKGKPTGPPPSIPNLKPPNKAKPEEKIEKKDKPEEELNTKTDSKPTAIKMKPVKITPFKALLSTSVAKPQAKKREKTSVAAIFNEDSQSEDEDMPPEAKMRMRNIGKDTPVPSGPNSFNKGKLGFCNTARIFEKSLETAFDHEEPSKTHAKNNKSSWNNNLKL